MSIVSVTQLQRISKCRAFPLHIRHIARELELASLAIAAARSVVESIPVTARRPESYERVMLRSALALYDEAKPLPEGG